VATLEHEAERSHAHRFLGGKRDAERLHGRTGTDGSALEAVRMFWSRLEATMIECEVDDARWLELVRSHPGALAFHHPSWIRLLSECYGFRPFVLLVEDGSGGLPFLEISRALRWTRWVSLPFTDSCPPLVRPGESTLRESIETRAAAAGVSSVEVRGLLDGATVTLPNAVSHVLRLEGGTERVARGFRPSVRRNIRIARARNVAVRFGESEGDLTQVYYRLHVETRRRLGLPVQPRRFFKLLWQHVVEPGLGRLLLAEADGRPAAGAVFLGWNHTLLYKYGASDPALWPLRPNNLLFAEAIDWASGAGYRSLDFGRTNVESASLRRFKLSWGAVEQPLAYSFVGRRPSFASGVEPPELLRRALRRSPRWVVRACGEIMYRHAA
jgi:CelD/BcsL family acetyltransferase involved in cellulose biosynthesis